MLKVNDGVIDDIVGKDGSDVRVRVTSVMAVMDC